MRPCPISVPGPTSRSWLAPAVLVALLAGAMGCRKEKVVVLYAAAETSGTIAPCGCTTDPLGGLSRFSALVSSTEGPHALVHAGRLERDPEEAKAPAKKIETDAKAKLIGGTFDRLGALTADRAGLHQVGPLKLAIIAPTPSSAQAAARGAAPAKFVRPAGADLVVALMDMPAAEARSQLRAMQGVDIAVLGAGVGDGNASPIGVGSAQLLVPGDRLQRIYRIQVHLRPGQTGMVYAGGGSEIARLTSEIERLRKQLERMAKDQGGDADFLAARKEELAGLEASKQALTAKGGVNIPASGNWFSVELVPIKQALPEDAEVAKEMKALVLSVDKANQEADCKLPKPAAVDATKTAAYVGAETCAKVGCHERAYALWKTTSHSRAWATLIADGRAHFHECIGCHVTGIGEPERKGATLCKPEPMENVQCEVCHGPGSLHVAAEGLEEEPLITRRPDDDMCALKCHTPEHSDTFELTAYLRDILGPGHGNKRKESLGPGVTGHELRQQGLKKAGRVH